MRVSVIERHDDDPLVLLWPEGFTDNTIREYIRTWNMVGNALDEDWESTYDWYVRHPITVLSPTAALRAMVNDVTHRQEAAT